MRRLLVTLLLALSGVVLTQMPAHACRCVATDTAGHVKSASDVFLGKVLAERVSGQEHTYVVTAERVYKGSAAGEVTLRSPAKAGDCALTDLEADRRYMFFGTQQGSVIEVNSCGGTAPLAPTLRAEVEAVLGEGRPPTPTEPPAPVEATFTRVDATAPTSFPRLAAPGAALVIVGLLGLLLLRRTGRAR